MIYSRGAVETVRSIPAYLVAIVPRSRERKKEPKMRHKKTILISCVILMFSAAPVFAQPVPPWEDPNQPVYTHYWTYDFNDGVLPLPTISSEGGNWDPGSDPTWTITGDGDAVSIVGGRLGLHNVTEDSVADIRLVIPNQRYDLDKWFWFSYDYFTTSAFTAFPSFGTDDPNSDIVDDDWEEEPDGHVDGWIRYHPQPRDEWMNIHMGAPEGNTIWIDNLKVGSVCVPEPGTTALLVLGGLALLRRKRK